VHKRKKNFPQKLDTINLLYLNPDRNQDLEVKVIKKEATLIPIMKKKDIPRNTIEKDQDLARL
jgi:hypothetical protein